MHTSALGRPRTLDRNKKTLLCDAVSRGATMAEAALTVGVSLRTVQREARLDPHFDQQLRIARTDKPDPLALMQSAARTHWRAAAWLLERTNPEDYGRRPASSCSPYQFEEAIKVVIDAALRLAPPENHARVYAELTAASETAFKAVFPNYGPYGRRLVNRLPDTPLANAQRLEVLRNPPPNRIEPDPLQPRALPGGRPALQEAVTMPEETPGQRPGLQVSDLAASVDRAAATHHEAPDPFAAPYLHPRALAVDAPPAQEVVATDQPTPGPTTPPTTIEEVASVTLSIESDESRPPVESTTPPPSAPAGRRDVARGASPSKVRQRNPKPQRGDVAPASRPSKTRRRSARALRPIAARTAPNFRKARRILTPKTRVASKLNAAHLNAATAPQNAPVTREAVAERAPKPELHVNLSVVPTGPPAS